MSVSAKGERYLCEVCGNEVVVEKVGGGTLVIRRLFFPKNLFQTSKHYEILYKCASNLKIILK
jgi:Desulfoferrodoxin, N-terminal domain